MHILRIDAQDYLMIALFHYSNYIPNTRQKRHGTMVASVAAGELDKKNSRPMHGVAFDADVLFVAIQLG